MVDARGVDNFLTNLYNDDDTDRMSSDLLQKIIDEEYMPAIKKAVSIYLYFSRKILYILRILFMGLFKESTKYGKGG